MNKTISELLDEIESKKEASKEIREAIKIARRKGTLIRESSDEQYLSVFGSRGGEHTLVYQMFVQPFVNVIKSAKLLAMDLSNSIQLIYKAITVVDDDELEDALEEFNSKRQEINKDWKPLMDAADKAIGSLDPIYMMSLMGPTTFMSIKGFGAGLAAGQTIAEVLTATRWEKLVNNFTTKLDPSETLNKNSRKIQMLQKRTLKKLNRLFFIPSGGGDRYTESYKRINEQSLPEEKEKMTEEEAVEKFAEITGIKKKLEELKIENSENLIVSVGRINEQIKPLTFTTSLLAASSLGELNSVIQEMNRGGIKTSVSLKQASESIKEKALELSKNPEFLKSLESQNVTEAVETDEDKENLVEPGKNQKLIDPVKKEVPTEPKVDPKKSYEFAEKAIFNSSKEAINMEIISQIKTSIPLLGRSMKDLKIDDKIFSEMKKSKDPVVIRASRVYEELQISYKKITEDLKKVVP